MADGTKTGILVRETHRTRRSDKKMMTLEDYLPQTQLLTLQRYNNTVISYQAYVRYGKGAIADYCRGKIGKEVRVTVKCDDLLSVEEIQSRHYENSDAPHTVILGIIE